MFTLKKLLPQLLFPVPLCAAFLFLGWVLWGYTKRKKLGQALALGGLLALLVCGYPWLPHFALHRLESQFAPAYMVHGTGSDIGSSKAHDGTERKPIFVMVLCASRLSADTNRTPAARIGDESLQRIFEGIRLHRALPSSELLISISGAAVFPTEKQQVLAELLEVFGMQTNSVRVYTSARDTEDEIVWCKEIATTNRVVLVSTASHLPRAMLLARRHGLDAAASPSGYLVDMVTKSSFSPGRLFPSGGNLVNTERALHEYLGLAWERLRPGTAPTEQK